MIVVSFSILASVPLGSQTDVFATDKKNKALAENNSTNIAENDADSSSIGVSSSNSSNANDIDNTNANQNTQNQNNQQTVVIGNGNGQPATCEECFMEFLTEQQLTDLLSLFGTGVTLEQTCDRFHNLSPDESIFRDQLDSVGVSQDNIDSLIECLKNASVEFVP